MRGYLGLDTKLEETIKSGTAIDTNSYGAMQRARQSKGNSVVLHELYFGGLVPNLFEPKVEMRAAIEKRFGSLDKWSYDFQASAKAAAGWAMLTYHPVNGKFTISSVTNMHKGCFGWPLRLL